MSKPKPSLLEPATIKALQDAAFPTLIMEFFGTITGMASALNGSKNPVKAANTMMKDPDEVKPGKKKSFSQMFAEFLERKRKCAAAQVAEIPEEIEELRERYNRSLPREKGDTDFEPEVFHEGAAQPDRWTDE